jgi:hypothetical protein
MSNRRDCGACDRATRAGSWESDGTFRNEVGDDEKVLMYSSFWKFQSLRTFLCRAYSSENTIGKAHPSKELFQAWEKK